MTSTASRLVLSVLYLAALAIPLGYLLIRARDLGWTETWEFVTREQTLDALWRSFYLGVLVAVACVALALPLAWLTHATDLPGRRLFRVLLNVPLAVPSYVSAFVILGVLAKGGWLYDVLFDLGIEIDVYSTWGTVLALMFTYPFALMVMQATLTRMDPRLWESARSLGASPWQAFVRVVLPGLRPAMASGGLLVALYTIGDFGAVSLMRYESLSYLIYVRYKSLFDREEAIILALLLALVASALVVLLLALGGRKARALSTHGSHRQWPIIRLGHWRWPSFALCALLAVLAVALPVAVVVSWLLRGVRLGHEIGFPVDETWTTVKIGVLAAVLIVAVAAVPVLIGRFRRGAQATGGQARAFYVMTHLGYALPGIVVALSMVSLATGYWYSMYQTVTLLLFAYTIRFLPLALHTIDDAVSAQNQGIFLAARSLGCNPLSAWWRAVLPTIRPALFAGFLAVFIAVIKELPITLLLSPIEFTTLATRIWMLTEDAYYSEVAPVVLALLGLAIAGLLLAPDTRRRA